MIAAEAPGWRGPRRVHTRWYVTDEQRSQPGWIGRESDRETHSEALRSEPGFFRFVRAPDRLDQFRIELLPVEHDLLVVDGLYCIERDRVVTGIFDIDHHPIRSDRPDG